jgi:PAS domain S-box-containing protein
MTTIKADQGDKINRSISGNQKQAEINQMMIESKKKYGPLYEAIPLAIGLIDMTGKVIYINSQVETLYEYNRKEIIGKSFANFNLFSIEDKKIVFQSFKQLLKGEIPEHREVQLHTKSGNIIWIELHASIVVIQDVSLFQVISRNINDRKKAEQELIELSKLRRDLISRASHELKTPLISVYSASELLLNLYKDQISSEAYEFVELVHKGAQRLKNLIENLLDASRIESGKLTLNFHDENIITIIKECVDDMRYLANKKHLLINLDFPNDFFLKIDKIRIEQVITNLLSNAIKNTPSNGRIDLKFVENKKWVDISITDTGIGLTENEKKMLFKRFGKIERMIQDQNIDIEGSGLGLVISKEITELHGGKILVKSKGRNQGSKFTLRLFKEKN